MILLRDRDGNTLKGTLATMKELIDIRR